MKSEVLVDHWIPNQVFRMCVRACVRACAATLDTACSRAHECTHTVQVVLLVKHNHILHQGRRRHTSAHLNTMPTPCILAPKCRLTRTHTCTHTCTRTYTHTQTSGDAKSQRKQNRCNVKHVLGTCQQGHTTTATHTQTWNTHGNTSKHRTRMETEVLACSPEREY